MGDENDTLAELAEQLIPGDETAPSATTVEEQDDDVGRGVIDATED